MNNIVKITNNDIFNFYIESNVCMMYNKYIERMFAERMFFEIILIIYEYISQCINIFKYKDKKNLKEC